MLNPSWLTGFVEGEGCFSIIVTKNKNYKTALAVQLVFIIALHERDQPVLILIKNCLGVGLIYRHSSRSIQLKVQSVKDFRVIINHFDKYPLITQKLKDYLLFKEAFYLFSKKEYLTPAPWGPVYIKLSQLKHQRIGAYRKS